jgi:UV excision repair protein RAD23
MKITVKTLQQKVFQVSGSPAVTPCNASSRPQLDAEGTDTIGDLKNKIQDTQGHAISSQKIIYSGEDSCYPTGLFFKLKLVGRQNPCRR